MNIFFKMKKVTTTSCACIAAASIPAADFASVFADNMVLQRETPLVIQGTALPGEPLTLAFAEQTVRGTAGADGKWRLELAPLAASAENREMILTWSNGAKTLKNVLVGEVWLASGQSNMDWHLKLSLNAEQTIAKSSDPRFRFCMIAENPSELPSEKAEIVWRAAAPETVGDFSAVAYYFGRELRKALGVPVGIVGAYRGGTMIEAWTPSAAFAGFPEVVQQLKGQFIHKPDAKSKSPRDWPCNQPSVLYNANIHPVVPFACKGIIWYQGCSNVWYEGAESYLDKQQALYEGWCKAFKRKAMPFCMVQIAPLNRSGLAAKNHPLIQEAQEKFATRNPTVKMAVVNDVGDVKNIHPANKEPVGRRLAALALKYSYGQNLDADSPILRKHTLKDGVFRLEFDHVASWRQTGPALFEIAGVDGVFQPAKVKISGADLLVSADAVPAPSELRYLWKSNAVGTLFNESGLPLGVFRIKKTWR